MNEQTEQTRPPAGALPIGVALDDIAEAVSRGVAQAMAGHDDVSGYSVFGPAGPAVLAGPLVVVVFCPPPPKQGVTPERLPDTLSQGRG